MVRWAKGGGVGFTATCGCIIGSCTAVNLVTPQDVANKIAADIMLWYEQTPFPSDIANQMAHNKQFPVKKYKSTLILPQEIAASPLCHVSVTRWCKKAGYASGSKERSERCARLTSDIVAFTASKLNEYHASHSFKAAYAMTAATQECRSCHSKGKPFDKGGYTRGKMQCNTCHDETADHSKI